MTVKDVIELRRQGQTEEAYEAIRQLYAMDKGADTSSAMFLVAVDIFQLRVKCNRLAEAGKILKALERLLPHVPDEEGWAKHQLAKCQIELERAEQQAKTCNGKPAHLQTGTWGEELAAVYLREKGYVILERNWHSSHRDIDIIAQCGESIVFVEVKTRRSTDFGDPVMAVTHRKLRNLMNAINHYVGYKHIDSPVRFDIITIVGSPGCASPVINNIEDVRIV